MTNSHAIEIYADMRRLAFGEQIAGEPPIPVNTQGTIEQLLDRLAHAETSFEQWMIWKALRQSGCDLSTQDSSQTFITICEFVHTGTAVTIVAHNDGHASMYLGSGGGVIGGMSDRNVRDAAAALCFAAGQQVSNMTLQPTSPAPPQHGEFVVSVLTPAGVCAARDNEKNVRSESHPLHAVYWCMHRLITHLRLVESGKTSPSTEQAGPYANCLLTLLAENGSGDVTLIAGEPLPDLLSIAKSADQREWIAREGPDDASVIDSRHVMQMLKKASRFGWFKRSGTFHAKLARADGTALDVVFQVERGKDHAGRSTLRFRL